MRRAYLTSLLVTAVALLTAGGLAFVELWSWAAALGAAAGVAMLVTAHLRMRMTFQRSMELQRRLDTLSATVGKMPRKTLSSDDLATALRASRVALDTTGQERDRALVTALDKRATTTENRVAERLHRMEVVEARHFHATTARVGQVPLESAQLGVLASDLLERGTVPPLLGGWAMETRAVVALVEHVMSHVDCRTIVELGSGTSTVWISLALRKLGAGHCTSLDHDPVFADITRADLARNGVDSQATVVDAPLVETIVDEDTCLFYDLSGVPDGPIDLLVVDGPPAATGPAARRPALPLLLPRLRVGSVVMLDDTVRDEERDIVAQWCDREDVSFGTPFECGGATFMIVTRLDAPALS